MIKQMITNYFYFLAVSLFLLLTACQNNDPVPDPTPTLTPTPETAAITQYSNEFIGVTFQYPTDWILDDTNIDSITVSIPNDTAPPAAPRPSNARVTIFTGNRDNFNSDDPLTMLNSFLIGTGLNNTPGISVVQDPITFEHRGYPAVSLHLQRNQNDLQLSLIPTLIIKDDKVIITLISFPSNLRSTVGVQLAAVVDSVDFYTRTLDQ
ncbi:MAG TPA: hypothetical protein VLL52_01560 [Anaerolineae bacterium]|nr:hypothetical protein [Anaerolineae bacterium]